MRFMTWHIYIEKAPVSQTENLHLLSKLETEYENLEDRIDTLLLYRMIDKNNLRYTPSGGLSLCYGVAFDPP
jgi:hypothetical protein